MTAPHFFGALVRAMGLYWLTYGITYLPACFAPVAGYTPGLYIFVGIGDMLIGVFLIFKADGVVETCYSYASLEGQEGIRREHTLKQESDTPK